MAAQTRRLGKGLSALINPQPQQQPPTAKATLDSAGIMTIAVADLRANPRQPRSTFDETGINKLADSIRRSGVLQPVLVRPRAEGGFELVAGERRWRAAMVAGMTEIPAIVRDVSDAESLELALVENLQREDLNAIERATAYREYMDTFGVTADELAQRLGESRANVSNYLRILRLGDEIRHLIELGELGMGQARAIAGVADEQRQLALARMTVRRNLAVRQVEALAQKHLDGGERVAASSRAERPRHLADVEQALGRALGLRVSVQAGKKKNSGRIVICFDNLDEYERIAEVLGADAKIE